MNSDPPEKGARPVLPPRDPAKKPKQSSVYLPKYLWDVLDEIAEASGEYTRNEVIQLFLEDRVRAWQEEQQAKRNNLRK